ncbi:MAG: hypothetical protein LBJ59_12040 [Zoogloeaceae bacterium]|nr:hypothetical protein [Zoogloeaceae bacterium]
MTTQNETLSGVEIFRSGRHVDSTGVARQFSDADLLAMAQGYAPTRREAPIVIGHPALDAPAWGWVKDVRVAPHPEGARLVVDARDVAPAFAEMVRSRRFPKRSAAFYPPDHPSNPTPGSWYLRHVGFLGAQPPAIEGLKDIQFSDGEGLAVFSEEIQQPVEDANVDNEELARLQAQIAEQAATLTAMQAERDAAQALLATFAEAQRTERHAAHVAFCEAALNDGRLKPADRASAVAVLDALGDLKTVEFAETDARGEAVRKAVTPLEFVKRLIAGAEKAVQFGEHAPGTLAPREKPRDDAALADAARKLAAEKSISFAEAVQQIVTLGD